MMTLAEHNAWMASTEMQRRRRAQIESERPTVYTDAPEEVAPVVGVTKTTTPKPAPKMARRRR